MSERITVSEAQRAGVLSLPPSAYRVEYEADVLFLLRDRGSAVAAFSFGGVAPAAGTKTAEEERGRSRRGKGTS